MSSEPSSARLNPAEVPPDLRSGSLPGWSPNGSGSASASPASASPASASASASIPAPAAPKRTASPKPTAPPEVRPTAVRYGLPRLPDE